MANRQNADRFSKELNEETRALFENINRVVQNTGLYGWNLVTADTPVLTGRARASWLLTVSKVRKATKPPTDAKTRVYADPERPAISFDITKDNHVFITNNVDYIEYLEHGSATVDPPFAMVARATPAINKYMDNNLRKIK